MKQTELIQRLNAIEEALGTDHFLNLLYGWVMAEIEPAGAFTPRPARKMIIAFLECQERRLAKATSEKPAQKDS